MFASATSGDRPNNSKFSICSVRNISSVLDAIEENKKRNCFSASAGAFCGNKIVEAGEECDCGYDINECQDQCCYPRILDKTEAAANKTAKGCNRRTNTQCRYVTLFIAYCWTNVSNNTQSILFLFCMDLDSMYYIRVHKFSLNSRKNIYHCTSIRTINYFISSTNLTQNH